MPTDGGANWAPLVSVIVPTYGRAPALFEDALRSIFEQTYRNLEVLVVDDSPDPVEISDDPPVPIRRIRNEHDGVASARNSGIETADGELLAFIDDDDRWRSQKVERQVAAFRKSGPDVGVVVTGQQYVDEEDATLGVVRPSVEGDATIDLLHGRVNCAFSTLMIRAEAAAQTGGLDERFNVWEDLEWCLRLSNAWKFRSVPEPLVLRREGKYDQLTDNFVEMRDRTYSLFLEKHRPLAAKYGPSAERALVASLSRILGGEGLDNGHYADARRYLIRSIRYDPWSLTSYLYLLLSLGGRYTYRPANYLKRRLAGAGTADRFDSSEGSH